VHKSPERPFKDLYVTFRKELDPEWKKNLLAIPRKQRAMVRKALMQALSVSSTIISTVASGLFRER